MENKTLKGLNKFAGKSPSKLTRARFSDAVKTVFHDRSFLGKLRNSLIIFLGIIIIFKIVSYTAGVYLSGYAFASFIAYFSFFLLVGGGLFLSVYFPIKYGGEEASFSIKLPKLSKGRKSTKAEKELNHILKNERKSLMKITKEKNSVADKLNKMEEKYGKLQKEKKELEKKNSEKADTTETKKDYSSIFDRLLPKKEVVKEKGRVKTEMQKIKLTSPNRNLAKKFRKIPKQQEQRVELYRNIARNVQSEDGSFTISQVMEVLLELFREEVDNDRRKILEEIEGWVNEDAYTPLIRTEKGIRYHRIIK